MTAANGNSPPTSPTSTLRCIIWHAATGTLPGELLTSLSKRIGHMTVCTDGYAAFAEACLLERWRRVERQAGAASLPAGVLVLVQPTTLAGMAQVYESLQSYAPSVAVWCFDRSANPKLRAVVEQDVTSWSALPSPVPIARPARGTPIPVARAAPIAPVARMARPMNGAAAARPAGAGAKPVRGLLTEEELRMLLEDDGAATRRAGGRMGTQGEPE